MTASPQRSESSTSHPSGQTGDETDVQKLAEIKEYLEAKISELENEVAKLKDMLTLIDSNLRAKSFVPAISLRNLEVSLQQQSDASLKQPTPKLQQRAEMERPGQKTSEKVSQPPVTQNPNQRQLRRTKDSMALANAFIEPDKVIIVLDNAVKLSQHTPPFESFFVNRILKGYQSRDEEDVKAGKLKPNQVLQYIVQEAQGSITSVTVSNYREGNRLNEILSTITWAFTRMLEKK